MSFVKRHSFLVGVLVIVAVLAAIIAGQAARRAAKPKENVAQVTKVSLLDLSTLAGSSDFISSSGQVESLTQAELRSQVSSPVQSINVTLGQKVSRGQVLVTLKSSDVGAQVAQAEAILKSQEARLDEIKRGTRSEDVNLTQTRLASAKQALEDTQKQQDLLVANALKTFVNSGLVAQPALGNLGSASITVSGTYNTTEQGEYQISVYSTGSTPRFGVKGLETADGILSTIPQPLGKRGLFVQFSGAPSTNDTWTITIPNTKSPAYVANQNAYQSALETRDAAVNAAKSQVAGIESELQLKLAGATNEQIRGQEAAVEQARANVALAAAAYDKTVIRSPIEGTVASLPIKFGELVSPGAVIASVVNEKGLQVKAFISDTDVSLVVEGADVQIGDTAKGKVLRWSPAVGQTKTVEVNIVVTDKASEQLVVGQSVNVKIAAPNRGSHFVLPIQAVHVTSTGAEVFVVNDKGVLESKPIKVGATRNEEIEVTEGVSKDMKLVTPVYELQTGQTVEVVK